MEDMKLKQDFGYENYYYEITKEDLKVLKIGDDDYAAFPRDRSYIVNYSTGEVFDTQNRIYKEVDSAESEPIYLPGTNTKVENPDYTFDDE